jgi:RNA polymerase sigma factor (TIGR02999 family)
LRPNFVPWPIICDHLRSLAPCNDTNEESLNQLLTLVNGELRRIARRHMRMESPGHTLQTTALVNEAYLRLVDQQQATWQNRAQFFGIAAQIMRHILVDYARGAHRQKRGGCAQLLPLNEGLVFHQPNRRRWLRSMMRSSN